MKKILLVLGALLFVFSQGCKDNATGSSNPFGGGGGGTGGVTLQVALVQDQQGAKYFQFTPSTSVVVNSVRAVCAAAQVDETIQGDGTTVYSAGNPFAIGPIPNTVNLQTGQQWQFTVQGKIGSAQGTSYNVNANYTIP